jgi:hypothetical protein
VETLKHGTPGGFFISTKGENMGKNPASLFYWGDWTRDLDDQELEVEGAWIRICCRLFWSETPGQATKSLREWSRILRKSEKKTMKIFQILFAKCIPSGSILDNQNITIICRRMVRDHKISQLRREVGKLGGNPNLIKRKENLDNQIDNQILTPSVSVSVSGSVTRKELKESTPLPPKKSRAKKPVVYDPEFLRFWEAYPSHRRTDKQEAARAWSGMNGDRPPIEVVMLSLEEWSGSDDWNRENGKFVPGARKFIEGRYWEAEPKRVSRYSDTTRQNVLAAMEVMKERGLQ